MKDIVFDEDLLEQLYWEFDEQRKRTGMERDAFKGKMRFFARHTYNQNNSALEEYKGE